MFQMYFMCTCRGPMPQHKLLFPLWTGVEAWEKLRHSSHSNGRESQASLIPEDHPHFFFKHFLFPQGKLRWRLINILFLGVAGLQSGLQLCH